MKIFTQYHASEQRVHGLINRLLRSKWVVTRTNRYLNPVVGWLEGWQNRVGVRTRNTWILLLLSILLIYGFYTLYPLLAYLWNR